MATSKVKTKIEVDIKINIELSLEEAQALRAITSYGSKHFLEGYYKQLGKSYVQPYEKGVISLFETIKTDLDRDINKVIKATETIDKAIYESTL